MKVLDGVTVLDFTWMLGGPFCTMILNDLGARVLKVEAIGHGDNARSTPPVGGYFANVNRGKESICINIRNGAGKEMVRKLAQKVDVVVENFRPGVMDGLDLGYSHLSQIKPALVYASLSGFGQNGPLAVKPAFDIIIQAMAGVMSITGPEGGEPVKTGVPLGDMESGTQTALAILAGLYRRATTGCGSYIDMAMLDCQIPLLHDQLVNYSVTRENPKPIGNRHPSVGCLNRFRCADAYVVICCGTQPQWERLCEALGEPEMASDERFRDLGLRLKNCEALTDFLNMKLSTRTYEELDGLLMAFEIPFGRVNNLSEMIKEEQVQHREMIVEMEQPGFGKLLMTGVPYKFAGMEHKVDRPAPLLGQHTDSVLKGMLGLSDVDIDRLKHAGVVG